MTDQPQLPNDYVLIPRSCILDLYDGYQVERSANELIYKLNERALSLISEYAQANDDLSAKVKEFDGMAQLLGERDAEIKHLQDTRNRELGAGTLEAMYNCSQHYNRQLMDEIKQLRADRDSEERRVNHYHQKAERLNAENKCLTAQLAAMRLEHNPDIDAGQVWQDSDLGKVRG